MMVKFRRLWIQISADRKRFSILCVALAVALLFWARLIIISKAPRTVMAEDQAGQTTPSQEATEITPDNSTGQTLPVNLETTPGRDPFVISPQHFPRPDPVVILVPEAGKSDLETAEDPVQAALQRTAQLQGLVDLFTLDAVMTNPPMAVIGGKTYRPGSLIPGIDNDQIRFKLLEVRQGTVILECEDRQFELKMESPGP